MAKNYIFNQGLTTICDRQFSAYNSESLTIIMQIVGDIEKLMFGLKKQNIGPWRNFGPFLTIKIQ